VANSFTNIMPKILARGLMVLREQVSVVRLVNADLKSEAAQKGASIDVPIPSAVTATDVTPSATQPALVDTTPTIVTVNLNNWKEARFHLTDKDLQEIDAQNNFLPMQSQEAIRSLANAINASVLAEYKGVYGYVGTAGTTPFATTAAAATDARKVLNRQLAPRDNRRGVVDFDAEANALLLGPFADASQTMENGVKIEGEIGRKYGFDWFSDDQIPTHTLGAAGTALLDDTVARAVGIKTLHMDGFTTKPSVGDIFTIAGDTQTYTVTASTTLVGTDSDVSFEPGLKVAIPAADGNEAVTFKATHVVNLAFHRDAFAVAMRPLESSKPGGGENISSITSMTDPKTGISMRLELTRVHKAWVWSFDCLWGAKLVRAALATRIAG
jgi:hypothetical protein